MMGTMNKGLLRVGVVAALVSAAVGCQSTPRVPAPRTATDSPYQYRPDGRAGRKEVQEVKEMIAAGNLSVVPPRLLHIVSKYPDTEAAADARYWLGYTYYKISSYRDAIEMFNEYLDAAPDGKYAEQAAQYASRLEREYAEKFKTAAQLSEEIGAVRQKLADKPGDIDLQWHLADLLWQRGDYEEAGRAYYRMVQDHPEYAKHETVLSRIEILPSGEFTVLTPNEKLRRAIEKNPVAIVNEYSFQGNYSAGYTQGGSTVLNRPSYYVVTGQVVNRGDSTLYGVQVIINLYGFGHVIYDTNTVNIGRLNPGDIRAFSVRFTNFPDVERIYRHECIGTFQR